MTVLQTSRRGGRQKASNVSGDDIRASARDTWNFFGRLGAHEVTSEAEGVSRRHSRDS
jgi:hypothetical protein